MKSNTSNYIHLQRLYKTRAEKEKQAFKSHFRAPWTTPSSTWVNGGARSIRIGLCWVQNIVGDGVELSKALDHVIGEQYCSGTFRRAAQHSSLPRRDDRTRNHTKQYVPVKGYCIIDLINTWAGVTGA
ncbi:hypothetical protein HD554DRAFT_2037114 [Boletus coccyginus]|nr:hypothetical protein HD554DRAFT_2037114 [Boletus coccyginus]